MSGNYVVFSAASRRFYKLDDRTEPEEFAGRNVNVTGTLDSVTKTRQVASVKAAMGQGRASLSAPRSPAWLDLSRRKERNDEAQALDRCGGGDCVCGNQHLALANKP
jgi:hypothetical protein